MIVLHEMAKNLIQRQTDMPVGKIVILHYTVDLELHMSRSNFLYHEPLLERKKRSNRVYLLLNLF